MTLRAGSPAGVRVEGVSISYGASRVLKDVDVDVHPGEFFAFLGPSGCGKTTLLRVIAGFGVPQHGRVLIGGIDVTGLPPWRREVGMVFQSYALWPHMTVAANVAFGLEERGVARAEIARRVRAVLDLLGLAALERRYPAQLSGGQQQRVALARTLVIEPKVLLLDEPLSNLDAKLRSEVRRELRELQQRLGLTAIFVTHDQEEANAICDRIAVMNEGEVQQVGSPIELYDRPRNLFVAGFLGAANIVSGSLAEAHASRLFVTEAGALPIPPGTAVPSGARLVFRPQDARLVGVRERGDAPAAFLTGTVSYREFLGGTVRYCVQAGNASLLVECSRDAGMPGIGDLVAIAPEMSRAIFLAQ
jgi:iron(III) transport system ATP-binding protein